MNTLDLLSPLRRVARIAVAALLGTTLAASAFAAADSKGTDFWLMFPGNFFGGPALTLFISSDVNTSGTVEVPGLAFSVPFSVTANVVTSVNLPTNTEVVNSDVVEDKGIHVTSQNEVSVYGLSRIQFTTDAYLGLPTDVLGTDYMVLGYKNVNVVNGTQFGVVAAVNGTTVTITPSVTTGAHVVGVPYNVALNQGQTYMLRNTDNDPADLVGTVVTANQPIAVFGGHQCADIPDIGTQACDYLVEEMPPTPTWGKNFLTVPLATRIGGDTFRILAQANGTTVNINGAPVATLNRGQYHQQLISGQAVITSNEGILVAQYSNGTTFDGVTSDPFEMLVPPREQYQDGYTVSTPASGFVSNFINIVAPTAAVGAIQLDGVTVPAGHFTPIGASGFSGAQESVVLGSHHVSSTQPYNFGVFVYGFDSADSYGYPGGLLLGSVDSVTTLDLTPPSATNPVGTQHCVTATVRDQNHNPLQDINVVFSVVGANPQPGVGVTNASGEAQFCYIGTNAGADTIRATAGDLTAIAYKLWTGGGQDNPPVIACPEDTYVPCKGGRGNQVFYTVTATDDHDPNPTIVCVPPPGSYFPVGWSDVTCTATDNTGKSDTCAFRIFVFPTECPNGPNYWKRHPRRWPVTELVLGTITYDQDRLIGILDLEPGGDASVRLARQLIAAKLNVENCVDPRPILKTIQESDALLTGKVPMLVPPRSPLGRDMVQHAQWLNNFNDGLLFPGCKNPTDLTNGIGTEQGELAGVSFLRQNAPNPFGESTNITFALGHAAPARVVVYDVSGRELKVLANGMMEAGTHTAVWDGTDANGSRMKNGVYFYRLVTDEFRSTMKMIMMGR